jgi:glucose-6-phosphate isomerase
MTFDPGFDIDVTVDPMGFTYGSGVFGPKLELRHLDAIRPSLLDPSCDGPDPVYAIAMDVGTDDARADLIKRNLLYGAVTYAAGSLGAEPVRSQGHVHAVSKPCGASTAELYEIWSGARRDLDAKSESSPRARSNSEGPTTQLPAPD